MKSLGVTKPLIVGEYGTPHTTRPAPSVYGTTSIEPITNLDDVPASEMGIGKPYYAAIPVATFLTEQWNTIKANLASKTAQICVGGFIFEWCDEYWKAGANYYNVQVGGPDGRFKPTKFAGNYEDEAGFGVTSAVNQSFYGKGKPNISRTVFKGYEAVKDFYNASSHSGGELY
jgi:hypothetical protein